MKHCRPRTATLFILTASCLLCGASAFAFPGHGLKHRSRVLTAEAGDGTGPDYVILKLSPSPNSKTGYDLTVLCPNEFGEKPAGQAHINLPIRFRKLEGHEYPSNDYWEENGTGHKRFPHALFVAHGTEDEKPVTVVWVCGERENYKVKQIARVFDGDARRLDQPEHGSKKVGGILIEHAHADWLPRGSAPVWAKADTAIQRTWTYTGEKFLSGPWQPGR